MQFRASSSIKIQGTVDGGSGANTLEFVSAASVSTLTGVGAYFAHFGIGTIDAGARWVFAGDNAFSSTAVLTDAGTLTNIGTISGDLGFPAQGNFTRFFQQHTGASPNQFQRVMAELS